MPWWASFIFLVLGWMFKVIYDWKIQPAITKSHKNREKKEFEKEEKEKRDREEKIKELNQTWKRDRKILSDLQQPLKEFNQMNRFPDRYKAPKCLELASNIEKEAQNIQRPEFQKIKGKLIEYAGGRNQIDQNTPLRELRILFQRQIEPNKYEPLKLCEEIEEILVNTSTPPFSEKDIQK